MRLDVLIIGGGIAGLWLLDGLHRAGHGCALVENAALGAGQTIWSQGIIHGGAKYTLRGIKDSLANVTSVIYRMPELWSAALAGTGDGPNLEGAVVRAPHCHLWRTTDLSSRLGLQAATMALKVRPQVLSREERPLPLVGCPGEVFRLPEQVISPASVLARLAVPHLGRLVAGSVVGATRTADGLWSVVIAPADGGSFTVEARAVVLTAGAGNGPLRQLFGRSPEAMQIRPLRMIMARGPRLPELNGHCIDGAKTRVTITTDRDAAGRVVWQVGGQVAEDGVTMEPAALVEHTRREVTACVPGIDLTDTEWTTYQADRAEAATGHGRRPDDATVLDEQGLITVWPTKLVLAPRVAELVGKLLPAPACDPPNFQHPAPPVATPPWDEPRDWMTPAGLN